jgi:hypothetical protein
VDGSGGGREVGHLGVSPVGAPWGAGRAGFDPDLLLTVLILGYCLGQRSSRQLERPCVTDGGFRVAAANQVPDHTVLARFRKAHADAFEKVCSRMCWCWLRVADWCGWIRWRWTVRRSPRTRRWTPTAMGGGSGHLVLGEQTGVDLPAQEGLQIPAGDGGQQLRERLLVHAAVGVEEASGHEATGSVLPGHLPGGTPLPRHPRRRELPGARPARLGAAVGVAQGPGGGAHRHEGGGHRRGTEDAGLALLRPVHGRRGIAVRVPTREVL